MQILPSKSMILPSLVIVAVALLAYNKVPMIKKALGGAA